MNELVTHLSEQHQFYVALLDKFVSLVTMVYLGCSHPPAISNLFKPKQ